MDIQRQFRDSKPYWLVTITLPSLTIQLASPAPLNGFVAPVDAGGRSRTYGPGLVTDDITIKHSLLGEVPGAGLEFYIPEAFAIQYPASLQWDRATCEIAQWFEGTPWEDRRVLLSDLFVGVHVGGASETVTGNVVATTFDTGRALNTRSVITGGTWPDVDDEPVGYSGAAAYDLTQRHRAFGSRGSAYGEIVGFPRWISVPVVVNEVLAEHTTSTDRVPVQCLVCDGSLKSSTARRMKFVATERKNQTWIVTPVGAITAGTDADGRAVTLLSADIEVVGTAATPIFVPSAIVVEPEFFIANLPANGMWVQPGDCIKMASDGDSYYRVVTNITAGHDADSSYHDVVELQDEYGGLLSPGDDDTTGAVTYAPLVKDARSVYLDFTEYGGRAKFDNPGAPIRTARDAITAYLKRSVGIRIDWEALAADGWLDYHRIDGHMIDPDVSPLDWFVAEILPFLPCRMSWEGGGLRLRKADPLSAVRRAFLTVGKAGTDGERISKRPTLDPAGVVNDITIRYGWDESLGTFGGLLFTAGAGYSANATIAGGYMVNERAIASQALYGRRSVTIETRWTNDAATARKMGNQILNQQHKPRWRVAYWLAPSFGYLEVNDEVEITDSEMGITAQGVRIIEITHSRRGPVVTVEELG